MQLARDKNMMARGVTKEGQLRGSTAAGHPHGHNQLTSASKETEMTLVKVPSIVWGRENWYSAFNFRSRKENPFPTARSLGGPAACL